MTAVKAVIQALAGDMIPYDGYVEAPLLVWSTAAEEIENSSGSSIEGRYHAGHGSAGGSALAKAQDTTLASGRNTGTTFTAVTGAANTSDNSTSRAFTYRLLFDNASAGQSWDWVQSTTNDLLPNEEIVLRRGPQPNGVVTTATNFYAYLHLNYQGINGDYRIPFVTGLPICLQYAADGTTFRTVDTCQQVGNPDRWFDSHGDNAYLIIKPFYEDNLLSVELAGGGMLVHGIPSAAYAPDPTVGSNLPYGGKIRWTGLNGWTSLEVYPMRHQPVTVTKSNRRYGGIAGQTNQKIHAGMAAAVIVSGSRSNLPAAQTLDYDITTDGQNFAYSATATQPDAGDGLGSEDAPRLAETVAIIPTVWTFDGDGDLSTLQAEMVDEVQTWNDQARCLTTAGRISSNNYNRVNDGAVGRTALFLSASNDGGATFWARCRGVFGVSDAGLQYDDTDVRHEFSAPFQDFSVKMSGTDTCLSVELIVDGWCLWSAVRALCELGNIHPQYLTYIPFYLPPGTTSDAPYGPAGEDCPYYILPRGTGLNPKFRFTPEMSAWSCLQMLVQELGEPDPNTGRIIPYYMGFDFNGQFHFEPYDPFVLDPVILYSDVLSGSDPGTARMHNAFHITSSVEQMRTDIVFEGLNAYTNELDYVHIPQPDSIAKVKGYRSAWVERNARWGTQEYLERVANVAAVQSAIPDQLLQFQTFFIPYVNAGDVCLVNRLGQTSPYVVTQLRSRYGVLPNGYGVCESTVIARSIYDFI